MTAVALLGAAGAALPANAATAVYSDRATYASQLFASVTDNYENPGYAFVQNDAQMSAVLGETTYTATGFANLNLVNPIGPNHFYCSGCNASFKLGFETTSVSSSGGVFGVGFDLFANSNFDAFVTFANGSTALYSLPTNGQFVAKFAFWGITSDLGIRSIYVGHGGMPSTNGNFGLDDLQIGSAPAVTAVPEPTTWALMLAGFGALGGILRRGRARLAVA